jgi:DNA-directed RNA polymerase subunit RPC12/RpoP
VRFADFPVVRFQDYLRELRLTPKQDRDRIEFQYTCARCGKEFYSTYKAPPRQNMYCNEHRIWRDRESSYSYGTAANDHYAPAGNGNNGAPMDAQALVNTETQQTTEINSGAQANEAEKSAYGQPAEGNTAAPQTEQTGGN